ncbi:MAG: hypothetical protein IPN29_20505 [Saprospiraceae bacterium]|nr:hypothetical protein [Saprospiraceae bacterium]
MTIKDTIKKAPVNITKAARSLQNSIREWEETSRGNFIAFVDDGKFSFDTSIQLDEKSHEIILTQCDCGDQNPLCAHVLAVLLFMNASDKTTVASTTLKKIRKKKLSPTEELLDSLDNSQLRTWLLEELQTNKELQLKFTSHFDASAQKISSEALTAYGDTCVQAIVGKKKYIEPVQLKLLFEVWQKYLDTQLPNIYHELGNKDGVLMVDAIFTFYQHIDARLRRPSSRVGTQIARFIDKISAYVQTLDEAKIFDFFELYAGHLKNKNKSLSILLKLIYKVSPAISKARHAALFTLYLNHLTVKDLSEDELLGLLNYTIDHDLFSQLYELLPYVAFYNDYNLLYLSRLMGIGKFELVITQCEKSISRNFQEVYNIPYYQMLVAAHKQLSDEKTALHYRTKIYRFAPSYKSYLEIYNSLSSRSQKEAFKKEALSRAIRPGTQDYALVLDLKFGIWAEDEEWNKIFEKLTDLTSLLLAEPYLKKLHAYNEALLLKKLLNDCHGVSNYKHHDEAFDLIEKTILKYYTLEQIQNHQKNYYLNASVRGLLSEIFVNT